VTAAGALFLALLLAQGHGTKGGSTKTAPKPATKTAKSKAVHGDTPKHPARTRGGGGSDSAGDGAAERSAASETDVGAGGSTEGKVAAGETGANGKTMKTKVYNFGAMDVEGKLKTPQLLYFLNRVKLELDMSAPDKRSFMKELEKSADDKNL
jgi:hypothetical protein